MLRPDTQEWLRSSFKEDNQEEIVWPPMVIILNTEFHKFLNGKVSFLFICYPKCSVIFNE